MGIHHGSTGLKNVYGRPVVRPTPTGVFPTGTDIYCAVQIRKRHLRR
jgi:hypothetical protein